MEGNNDANQISSINSEIEMNSTDDDSSKIPLINTDSNLQEEVPLPNGSIVESEYETTSTALEESKLNPQQEQQQGSIVKIDEIEKRRVWEGELVWNEIKPGTTPVEKIPRKVACQAYSFVKKEQDEVEVNGDDWPSSLKLSLMAYKSVFTTYVNKAEKVLFKFEASDDDTSSLKKLIESGYVGCILLPTNGLNKPKFMILLYFKNEDQHFGIIPNDQPGFFDELCKIIQQNKSSTTTALPQPNVGLTPSSTISNLTAITNQNLPQTVTHTRGRRARMNYHVNEAPTRPPVHVPPTYDAERHNLKLSPPVPPNWDESFIEAQNQEVQSSFTRFPLKQDSKEYSVIAEMLKHVAASISGIDRIVNPGLWNKFIAHRKELIANKSLDWVLLAELGIPADEIERKKTAQDTFRLEPSDLGPYFDNIVLLWHGTKNIFGVHGILEQGLDERLGNNGLLGRGIYFTDNPIKAANYDATGTLLLFAVMLGDCLAIHPSNDNNNKIKHVREPSKMYSQQRTFQDKHFDSIIGRPTDRANEYVIYNRAQCVPLYAVNYTMKWIIKQSMSFYWDDTYAMSRCMIPYFAWVSPQYSKNRGESLDFKPDYGFYAQRIFDKMEEEVKAGKYPTREESELFKSAQDKTTQNDDATLKLAKPEEVDQKINDTADGQISAPGEEPTMEECGICLEEFPNHNKEDWKVLSCKHKLCTSCHGRLGTTGTTMSGSTHTFIKCPYCKSCSGLEIGSCPNGTMYITEILEFLDGYDDDPCNTIMIEYKVQSGLHRVNRTCYLPNNSKGKAVLELLCEAWDRRLIFSIGTSASSLASNVLVWNIHHKTSLTGGVENYGYPDPTYLDRVKEELAQYGIK